MSDLIIQILAASMLLATPLLLAAIGELVVEKSGVINLGVEGMMLIGGLAGFIALYQLQTSECTMLIGETCFTFKNSVNQFQYIGSLIIAAIVGAMAAALFGFLTQYFRANHIAAGLGLTVLGAGLSNSLGGNFFGVDYTAAIVASVPPLFPKAWGDVPLIGPLLFSQNLLVPFSFVMLVAVWFFLNRTRAGLIVRAVGENHHSAYALGYPVIFVRMATIMFGGAMAGLAGAFIVIAQIAPKWTEGITVGKGWLALALILFSTWRPGRVLLGAYLFGIVLALEPRLKAIFSNMSLEVSYFLTALPYIVPVVVLVLISRNPVMIRRNAPASLGQSFEPRS